MIKKLAIVSLACSMLALSCSKKDDPSPNPPGGTTSFTWTENGGPVITADSAYWTTGSWGTGIRASKGGMDNYFEINWTPANNTVVGMKTLDASSGGFTFLKGSATYSITVDQDINITSFASDKMDGGFNLTVSGGSITNIKANFTGLPKK
ncbi:MAG: hypothetical protein JST36_03410 [Bacteroidetes bacterium]|nr:hypothetical protein [Bacteroidota bacterium]